VATRIVTANYVGFTSSQGARGVIWARQLWQPWQRDGWREAIISNLQIVRATRESESHPHRQLRINNLRAAWANEAKILQSAIMYLH
jgi:hypothetical protein